MKRIVFIILGGFAILVIGLIGFVRLSYVYGPWKDPAVSASLSATDILSKIAIQYKQCQSYKDEGKMTTWFISTPLLYRTWSDFKTAFHRPSQFRFEYRESGLNEKALVVWRQDAAVQTWWWINGKREKSENLSCAIAAATGVSGGTAYNITSILLPDEIKGHKLTSAANAYRISDGTYQGTPCYRLQTFGQTQGEKYGDFTQPPSKTVTTYWIDQDTFSVLKIDEVTSFPWLMVRAHTNYSPVFDKPISPNLLEFEH